MREINIQAPTGYRFVRMGTGFGWQIPLELQCGKFVYLSVNNRDGGYGANQGQMELAILRTAEFASAINLSEDDVVEGFLDLIEIAQIIVFLKGKTLEEIDKMVENVGYLDIRKEIEVS
jgi:hypothetical protein